MSDRVVKAFHDDDGSSPSCDSNLKERGLLSTHQSRWMSHWMQRTHKPASSIENHSSLFHIEENAGHKKKCLLSGLKITSDASFCTEREGKGTESRTVGAIDTHLIPRAKNFSSERLCYQPIINLSQDPVSDKSAGILTNQKHGYEADSQIFSSSLAFAVCREDILQQDNSSHGHDNLKGFGKRVTSHLSNERKDLAALRSSGENVVGSTSSTMPYVFNHANTSNSDISHAIDTANKNLLCLDQGHGKYEQHPKLLFHQKKMMNHLDPVLGQKNGPVMQHHLSTSSNFLQVFFKSQCQQMQNGSTTGLLPSCSNPPDVTETENLNQGRHPPETIASSLRNVETMRICSTVDSVENSPGRLPKFSQMTHQILFTRKTDVNLSSAHQELRESTISTQHKGLVFSEHIRLASDIGSHWQHGVTVKHPLWSSANFKEREDVCDARASRFHSKNRSSSETNTVNMHVLQEKDVTGGMASSLLTKDVLGDLNMPIVAVDSGREKTGKIPVTQTIPDINEQLPDLEGKARSKNVIKPSISKTQSLDAENLLSYAERHSKLKSNHKQDCSLCLEPSSRWVKRLKLSSSASVGLGTENSKITEASSHDKIMLFKRIIECSRTNSEHRLRKHHAEELTALGQSMQALKDGECSSLGGIKESQRRMLTHSWIKRWLHNHSLTSRRNPEAVVICELARSKLAMADLEKKQFPSIDAMALMGKAMKGFHPCEFRKRGAVTVWNAMEC